MTSVIDEVFFIVFVRSYKNCYKNILDCITENYIEREDAKIWTRNNECSLNVCYKMIVNLRTADEVFIKF